jgi:hypothetical protein
MTNDDIDSYKVALENKNKPLTKSQHKKHIERNPKKINGFNIRISDIIHIETKV